MSLWPQQLPQRFGSQGLSSSLQKLWFHQQLRFRVRCAVHPSYSVPGTLGSHGLSGSWCHVFYFSSSYSSCCFHPTWNNHPYRSTYVSGLCKYLHELVNIKMPWHTGAWEVTPGSAAQVVRQKLLTNMSPQLQSEVCTEMNLAIRQVAMEDLRIGRNLAKVQKNELFFPICIVCCLCYFCWLISMWFIFQWMMKKHPETVCVSMLG